jgi:hypothetical protein
LIVGERHLPTCASGEDSNRLATRFFEGPIDAMAAGTVNTQLEAAPLSGWQDERLGRGCWSY